MLDTGLMSDIMSIVNYSLETVAQIILSNIPILKGELSISCTNINHLRCALVI